jgi:hypothetical protein
MAKPIKAGKKFGKDNQRVNTKLCVETDIKGTSEN